MTTSQREQDNQTVRAHIASVYRESLRPAAGPLRHGFIDPGAGYRDLCWDWDASALDREDLGFSEIGTLGHGPN